MLVSRFMCAREYEAYMAGKTLVNEADHYNGGHGGSISKGFCFTADKPKQAWKYLKSIVSYDYCLTLDIPLPLLTKSKDKYTDWAKDPRGLTATIRDEYCTTEYSKRTAKLVRTLRPKDFAADDDIKALEALKLFKQLYGQNY